MTLMLAASGSALSGPVTLGDVALSVSLVAVAVASSAWQRLGLEADMTVATVRSFFQLIAVGYVLSYIFSGHGWLTVLAVAVMVGAASLTSRGRAKQVPWSGAIALAAIAVATAATLGVLAVLDRIDPDEEAIQARELSTDLFDAGVVERQRHDLGGEFAERVQERAEAA